MAATLICTAPAAVIPRSSARSTGCTPRSNDGSVHDLTGVSDLLVAEEVCRLLGIISRAGMLEVLSTLLHGRHNVGEIADALELDMCYVSRRLAVLRQIGLVTFTRSQRERFYELGECVVPSTTPPASIAIYSRSGHFAVRIAVVATDTHEYRALGSETTPPRRP